MYVCTYIKMCMYVTKYTLNGAPDSSLGARPIWRPALQLRWRLLRCIPRVQGSIMREESRTRLMQKEPQGIVLLTLGASRFWGLGLSDNLWLPGCWRFGHSSGFGVFWVKGLRFWFEILDKALGLQCAWAVPSLGSLGFIEDHNHALLDVVSCHFGHVLTHVHSWDQSFGSIRNLTKPNLI